MEGESDVFDVTFPSALRSGRSPNDTVFVRAFLPGGEGRPVPVVILLHYLGATDLRLETNLARALNRRGVAAVLMTLPYHLQRTPPSTGSGYLATRPDPENLVAVMTQSVLDVRRTVDWIATRPEFDAGRIGIAGTSLGAIVAALSSGVEPRLGAAAFLLGGVDLAHIVRNSSRMVLEREGLRRRGLTEERLRELLEPVEPTRYLAERAPRPSYVIAARFDSVMPRSATERLIAALPEPHVLWLDTGHFGGIFVQTPIIESIARFFEAWAQGVPFRPPARLLAPTVRFALVLDADRGLQVAAGVDLWRSDARGSNFATALATPRGMQGFVGHHVTSDFALGISINPKRTAPGLFWSLVL